MLKADRLRNIMMTAVPWLRENPEQLLICARKGNIVATGQLSPSFEYRYKLEALVMDYPGDLDVLSIAILSWAQKHEPELIFNPQTRTEGITFEADILSNDCADILFGIATTDAVVVTREENGTLTPHPRDEPDYSVLFGTESGPWELVVSDEMASE